MELPLVSCARMGERQAMHVAICKSGMVFTWEDRRMSRSISAATAATASCWLFNGADRSRDGGVVFGGSSTCLNVTFYH